MTRRGWGCRGVIIQACLLAVLSIFGWVGAPGAAAQEDGMPAPVEVSWSPKEPKQGEVLHLWVNAPEGMHVEKGEMLSRPLHFSPSSGRSGRWDALFGIDMGQEPGAYEVSVRLAAAEGSATQEATSPIRILAQTFGEERFTIPDDSKVHLSPESLARVKKERVQIAVALARRDAGEAVGRPFSDSRGGEAGEPLRVEAVDQRRAQELAHRHGHQGAGGAAGQGGKQRPGRARGRLLLRRQGRVPRPRAGRLHYVFSSLEDRRRGRPEGVQRGSARSGGYDRASDRSPSSLGSPSGGGSRGPGVSRGPDGRQRDGGCDLRRRFTSSSRRAIRGE